MTRSKARQQAQRQPHAGMADNQRGTTGDTNMADAIKAAEGKQAGWLILVQSVGQKVEDGINSDGTKKYKVQEVGKVSIPVPSIEAFGIPNAEVSGYDEDTGLPIYKDDKLDWLYQAAVAQAKVQARNKLVNGTATLKDGVKIAENFEELTAESERRGNAEALKLLREAQQAFIAFMQGLNKSAETVAFASGLFKNQEALRSQPADMKGKMKGYLTQFTESLSEDDLARYVKPLSRVEDACAVENKLSDF